MSHFSKLKNPRGIKRWVCIKIFKCGVYLLNLGRFQTPCFLLLQPIIMVGLPFSTADIHHIFCHVASLLPQPDTIRSTHVRHHFISFVLTPIIFQLVRWFIGKRGRSFSFFFLFCFSHQTWIIRIKWIKKTMHKSKGSPTIRAIEKFGVAIRLTLK